MWMEIPLTQGRVALVDAEDYPALIGHKWYYRNGYAARAIGAHGSQTFLLMQNVIMGVERGTDHIDRDRLNNQKSNLRVVDLKVQNFNRSFRKRSLPRGVYPSNNGRVVNRYFSSIRIDGKRKHLGTYDTPEEAHSVFREKALEIYGEYPPEHNE